MMRQTDGQEPCKIAASILEVVVFTTARTWDCIAIYLSLYAAASSVSRKLSADIRWCSSNRDS